MTANDRFMEFFEYLKKTGKISTKVQLASILGTNSAGINDIRTNKKSISIESLRIMKISYPELNLDYVICGDNPMILKKVDQNNIDLVNSLYKEIVELQRSVIEMQTKSDIKKGNKRDDFRTV